VPVARGAAILGAAAAGEAPIEQIIATMSPPNAEQVTYRPNADAHRVYAELYRTYRALAAPDGVVTGAMRQLREATRT
jgi:ribulose kinase